MPLQQGEKLGPYEIISAIGKGDKGEVYQARDPRLRRDVAIKVSSARFSERFERDRRPGDQYRCCTNHTRRVPLTTLPMAAGCPMVPMRREYRKATSPKSPILR